MRTISLCVLHAKQYNQRTPDEHTRNRGNVSPRHFLTEVYWGQHGVRHEIGRSQWRDDTLGGKRQGQGVGAVAQHVNKET